MSGLKLDWFLLLSSILLKVFFFFPLGCFVWFRWVGLRDGMGLKVWHGEGGISEVGASYTPSSHEISPPAFHHMISRGGITSSHSPPETPILTFTPPPPRPS
ncbi:hypothetical protein L873DRAFT_481126 [Choiromyces venosus 120613-1]|uniref:Uncharacterized protein n=1 Tax=Choiromyces venosus 120613-1 TaxID=1336337 RepID=A0A3N4JUK9_9PEZI|nr:hypothetical protein L873DRAFT_481126 [Choiromyces venosus 120613-1]